MTDEQFQAIMGELRIIKGYVSSVGSGTNTKSKAPYMWEGDKCHVCREAHLIKVERKSSKSGEMFQALACENVNCKGFAYISKYPKKDGDVPF